MKLTDRHIFIAALCVIALVAVSLVGHWAYRRYLSPTIEPSYALYPTRGIDLSSHNGDVDFDKVRKSGIDFVILKATEGTSFIDRKFDANYKAARQAGLQVGAYHYFRFDCDGRLQANHFLSVISDYKLDFPPVFDVEKAGNTGNSSTEHVVNALHLAIKHFKLRGYDVMLYSNKDGYKQYIAPTFSSYPLWICSFTDPPGPAKWYMWQYSHRGHIDGINGNVDLNVLH